MKISIILPTYNEAKNIQELLKQIFTEFKKHKLNAEVVVVDDASPDNTGKIADSLKKKYKNLTVIHRPGKLGLGSAYKSGIAVSKGDIIFTMDADFSHDPKRINALASKIKQGYDISIGSRYTKGGGITNWNILRRLISKTANTVSKLILNIKPNDLTSGYRAYKKQVLKETQLDKISSTGYSFLLEILYRALKKGYKVAEVPIIFKDRVKGKSKLSKKEFIKYILTIIRLKAKAY